MPDDGRPLAVITGASSGIGLELARISAVEGFDLLIAADESAIQDRACELRRTGVDVVAVETDLATTDGVDRLCEAIGGRAVAVLMANAGVALGDAFLDEDIESIRRVIDTNIGGTTYLVHRVGAEMRANGTGRILLTGSIVGVIPGAFMAIYNGTKAFVNSFAAALRDELKETGITVTVVMPGATETNVFSRAGMDDTAVAGAPKDDPAMVAKAAFEAVMAGNAEIVPGLQNKLVTAVANILPSSVLATANRLVAKPRSQS